MCAWKAWLAFTHTAGYTLSIPVASTLLCLWHAYEISEVSDSHSTKHRVTFFPQCSARPKWRVSIHPPSSSNAIANIANTIEMTKINRFFLLSVIITSTWVLLLWLPLPLTPSRAEGELVTIAWRGILIIGDDSQWSWIMGTEFGLCCSIGKKRHAESESSVPVICSWLADAIHRVPTCFPHRVPTCCTTIWNHHLSPRD